jgi:hypothetical protein
MGDSFHVAGVLSLLICVYITLFYQVNIEYQKAEYYSGVLIFAGMLTLSFVQLTFTLLNVFYWYKLMLWHNPEPINRKPEEPEPVLEVIKAEGDAEGEDKREVVPVTQLGRYIARGRQIYAKGMEWRDRLAEELGT